jgi:hypothetical protein
MEYGGIGSENERFCGGLDERSVFGALDCLFFCGRE